MTDQVATFGALLARDVRVLRRTFGQFLIRTIMQPLMFVFVFAFVFPKIGQGFRGGGAGVSFTTVLVPGLIAVAINFQGIQAVALPLVQEFSYSKEIEDRVLSPVPVWVVGFEKIVAGAIQSLIAAGIVFPIVYLVHAHGAAPTVHVHHVAIFVVALVFSCLLASAMGLFIGTVIDPRKITLLFAVVVLPLTFLGCVYYPWAKLTPIMWLKIIVLVNPLVYMSEGLRTSLTPSLPHMPVWAFLLALIGGSIGLTVLSLRTFSRRVLS
ncbi:MAG TPA: ABC transporter permease [Gaiellaceae bacterium]|nr:ABC transporter permease [Gaiellaceae bacterium]